MKTLSSPGRRLMLITALASASFAWLPATAFAQATPDADTAASSGLEEIVVTARRKEERVQSVPISITAFSQNDIEKKRIVQVSDLAQHVPSLFAEIVQSDPNAFGSSQIRLRGLPGTVVYFADVPLGTTDIDPITSISRGTSAGLLYDLDNVEVIKGPQGTLFGKNSIGGLISIEPKKPTNNFEGYFEAKFGNYADREFEGALNVPIVEDKLLVRIAGQTQQRDGYTKDIVTGGDYDNRNYGAWRIGLTLRPSSDFENYLVYDGYYQHTNGTAAIPTYFNRPLLNVFFPGGQVNQILARQQAIGIRAVIGAPVEPGSVPGIGKDYFYGITDTATWEVSDNLTIKNIAAARVFKQLSAENDFRPLPLLNLGNPVGTPGWNDNTVHYTEELQLQGKSLADKLSWVVGGFLEFDHPLGYNTTSDTALGFPAYFHFHNSNRSQALFVHGIYDLGDYVDGLRLTAGYRYTWDYVSVSNTGLGGVDSVVRAGGLATNCTVTGGDNNCTAGSNAHFSSYGWNVSLDEQLDPDTLLYVRAGNAYRPGSTNPQAPLGYQDLKPEHVTDVEIGAKVDWNLAGMHFRTNGDLFHTDYKAIAVLQTVQLVQNGHPQAVNLETNAGEATLDGGELEITVVPMPGVEISPHASYIYSHYDKYPPVFGATEAPPFFFDPKWQVGVTGSYRLPFDAEVGDVTVSATYSFIGHQYVEPNGQDPQNIIPSYDNLDLRIDWNNAFGYPVDLGFFMTNVLDDAHITGVIPLYSQLGFTSVIYNEPRMFGFSVKYRFGEDDVSEPATAEYVPPPVQAPAAPVPKSYLVFFDFNKSDLTAQAQSIVDTAAKNAQAGKVTQLTVTGHTDTVGSDAYNLRLSKRRAESVATQLGKDGIPSSEIEIVAKGKRDLLVPTADGVREPQNRRVQVVFDRP